MSSTLRGLVGLCLLIFASFDLTLAQPSSKCCCASDAGDTCIVSQNLSTETELNDLCENVLIGFPAVSSTYSATNDSCNGNAADSCAAACLLPVELSVFTVRVVDRSVLLEWQTSSESNNSHFDIELASGIDGFKSIATVEGSGTTLEESIYSYHSMNLSPGVYRFRLRQVDFNGAFEYSETVEAEIILESGFKLLAYPNPFSSKATVELSVAQEQVVTLELFDLEGRRVAILHEGLVSPSSTTKVAIDSRELPNGLYLYRASGQHFVSESQQIVVTK